MHSITPVFIFKNLTMNSSASAILTAYKPADLPNRLKNTLVPP
ncbi:MAG: hypothetical protein RML40_02130 [Bacteroidota bacterium]|nr:hypothetical protein [Candidatus Kapabacteria bacterium]MDW8219307.1 hypothetical protein [Bacteroidota bacterium]